MGLAVACFTALPSQVNAQCVFVGNDYVCLPDDIIQTGAINWTSVYSNEIQGSGINWASPASSVFTFTGSMTVDGSLSVVGTMGLDAQTWFPLTAAIS